MTRTALGLLSLVCVTFSQDRVALPVKRSAKLSKNKIYVVEGLVRLPRGVELTLRLGTTIIGKGKNAVLEVRGTLKMAGTRNNRSYFKNVTVRPAERFEEIHLYWVNFEKSAALIADRKKPVKGRIYIERTTFDETATLTLAMKGGSFDLIRSLAKPRVRILCEHGPVKVKIFGCFDNNQKLTGLEGGLILTGAEDAIVRRNNLGGGRSAFVDCRKLTFDMNTVHSRVLEFRQSKAGFFAKTKILKCDLYCKTLSVRAPPRKGKPERLYMDKIFVRGLSKADILAQVVDENGVRVVIKKVLKKPQKLGGASPGR